jgi:hypothetical protein
MCVITKNLVLNFNTILFSWSEKKGRSYFHTEIQYKNTKFDEVVINIKRKFDSYLSIENVVPENGYKVFVMIRAEDLIETRNFFLEAYKTLKGRRDEIYKIAGSRSRVMEDAVFVLDDLPQGATLVLKPCIIRSIEKGHMPGVKMYINSKETAFEFPLKKLSGLAEYIGNSDLFLYAQNAMTYVGRPPMGTNLIDLAKNEPKEEVKGVKGRKIPGPKTSSDSFFDI